MSWQLHEAQNKLSQVVQEARKSGPQTITVRGTEAAVVLSIEKYRGVAPKQESLAELLASSPLRGGKLEIERLPELGRDIAL
jgi:antitoxin Phd